MTLPIHLFTCELSPLLEPRKGRASRGRLTAAHTAHTQGLAGGCQRGAEQESRMGQASGRYGQALGIQSAESKQPSVTIKTE